MRLLIKFALVGTRLFLGLIFFTSGMGKLTRGDFPGLIGPVWLEERLAPYGLGLWVQFVAWSQVTIGLLLLSQRFATLGAIMLLPMITNIFVVTVSLQWQGTPFVNAFLIALNLFLLICDFHKIKFLFVDEKHELNQTRLPRSYPQIDFLWFLGFLICLTGGAVHSFSRWLTFGLAALGISLFLACAVWQILADRKASNLLKI
jgi:uncharacterized membrane protein YphA (DoxX/SURF4 family)